MMKKLNTIEQMEQLKQKAESIQSQYAEALASAKDEFETLTAQIAESEAELHQLYKHYVLDIVSLDAYQSEQKRVNDMKAVLSIAERKVDSIDGLLKEELAEIHTEAFELAVRGGFTADAEKVKADNRKAVLKAKHDYLKLITVEAESIIKMDAYKVWIESVEVASGKKARMYTHAIHPEYLLSNPYSSVQGADVTAGEVIEAFSGKITPKLLQEAEAK